MHNDSIRIPLSRGKFALVDPEDAESVLAHRWYTHASGYACRARKEADGPGSETIFMHRAILNPPPQMHVDHVNGDKLDNRRGNLRPATTAQNLANSRRKKPNPSGFRGVYRHANTPRWQVKLSEQHVGYFDTPEEAARAYDRAARGRWGEFARLNFPDE